MSLNNKVQLVSMQIVLPKHSGPYSIKTPHRQDFAPANDVLYFEGWLHAQQLDSNQTGVKGQYQECYVS